MVAGLAPRGPLGQARAMRQAVSEIEIRTPSRGLHDCTDAIKQWVADTAIATGLLTLFMRHTSCSLLIQENAAPAARRDLEAYFAAVAPKSTRLRA